MECWFFQKYSQYPHALLSELHLQILNVSLKSYPMKPRPLKTKLDYPLASAQENSMTILMHICRMLFLCILFLARVEQLQGRKREHTGKQREKDLMDVVIKKKNYL